MPFPNEHAARLVSPDQYKRFRRSNDKFGKGVHAIWGVTSDGTVELQAIRFAKGKFTVAEAKAWLKDHDYKPILFESAGPAENEAASSLPWNSPALVLNEGTATEELPLVANLQRIVGNIKKAKTRYETFEGRQYLVVPMVMLTEGVHAGSQGPLLYRNEDMGKTPEAWNHKPVVVYHPTVNGVGVSACDPDILESRKVGYVFNTKHKDSKLSSEAWLDVEKTKAVDDRILSMLEEGKMVEVSTGLFCDNLVEEGEWNGEKYSHIATNFRPDHLAILPDKKGACSIADGAGLLRNAQHGMVKKDEEGKYHVYDDEGKKKLAGPFMTRKEALEHMKGMVDSPMMNEASHDTIRSMLYSALGMKYPRAADNDPTVWIEAVFSKFVIYAWKGKLYRLDYTATDTEASLEGDPEEVVRVTEYRTKEGGTFIGNHTSLEECDVNKTLFVAALIANALTPWEEKDRAFLMGLSEDHLRKLAPALNDDGSEKKPEPKKEVPEEKKPEPTPAPAANQAPVQNAAPKTPTVQEYVANAPEGMRDMLMAGLRAHEQQKAQLVKAITSNSRNPFPEADLQKMSLEQLQKLAVLAAPVEETAKQVQNFAGLGDLFPAPSSKAAKEEALDLPVLNFEKVSAR